MDKIKGLKKSVNKNIIRIIIVFWIALVMPVLVNASLSCDVTTNCGYTDLFHMSNITNAHAELNNNSDYSYIVCCRDTENVELGTGCSEFSATLLHLSDETNAHVELVNESQYSFDICLNGINSRILYTYADNCVGYQTCVVSLPTDITKTSTNLQVSDCVTNPYTTKLCALIQDAIPPWVYFSPPTPENGTNTTKTSINISIQIKNASDLDTFKWNWDKVNYTIYNGSLVLMLNFDNVSALGESYNNSDGAVIVDLSKYGNNGTLYVGADYSGKYTNGKFGGAFEFDGIDDYVIVSDDTSLDISNKITIGLWIRPKNVNGDVLSKTNYNIMRIVLNEGGTKNIKVIYEIGGMDIETLSENNVIQEGEWRYIVWRYNGSYTQIFVDGQKSGSAVNASGSLITNNNPLYIARYDGIYFNGSIDEVRIWNRSLSDSEINELYFSNLRRYDKDRWEFYISQDSLTVGDYEYQGFAIDLAGNVNSTEKRTISICEDIDNDEVCDSDEPVGCVNQTATNIPANSSCETYYGFNYTSGCWIVRYAAIGTNCGVSTSLICNGSGIGSSIYKQTNISECDGKGYCVKDIVVGKWILEESCEWYEYCVSDDPPYCSCDDTDNDNVCDLIDDCIGQGYSNLPDDTLCIKWNLNSSGCWDIKYVPKGTVVGAVDCSNLPYWGNACYDFPFRNITCADYGEVNDGSCIWVYTCEEDPDTSREKCAENFGKRYEDVLCIDYGDDNCWDNDIIFPNPSEDTACCGDDVNNTYKECWVDDTNRAGCCQVGGLNNKVVYINDPDYDGIFCNKVGEKINGVSTGICDKQNEVYCWAPQFAAGISEDPNCCCCGDDPSETWSVFSSGLYLEYVIVDGICENGKWTNRTSVISTLYDVWTRTIS